MREQEPSPVRARKEPAYPAEASKCPRNRSNLMVEEQLRGGILCFFAPSFFFSTVVVFFWVGGG
jgi:hypothetical protein